MKVFREREERKSAGIWNYRYTKKEWMTKKDTETHT